jgi:hypothetical protein
VKSHSLCPHPGLGLEVRLTDCHTHTLQLGQDQHECGNLEPQKEGEAAPCKARVPRGQGMMKTGEVLICHSGVRGQE